MCRTLVILLLITLIGSSMAGDQLRRRFLRDDVAKALANAKNLPQERIDTLVKKYRREAQQDAPAGLPGQMQDLRKKFADAAAAKAFDTRFNKLTGIRDKMSDAMKARRPDAFANGAAMKEWMQKTAAKYAQRQSPRP